MGIICEEKWCYLAKNSVPVRFKDAKLNDGTKCIKRLKIVKNGEGIILSGIWGCGKTYGVCAYLLTKTGDWVYVTASELYNALKKDYALMNELKDIPILALDDLGIEYEAGSGFFSSMLDELINYRYNNFMTTIITTNLNLDDFTTRYGGRIVDRLKEWGLFYESTEESMRKRISKV